MKKIAIVGYKGRMGSLIFDSLKKDYLIVGVDRENSLNDFEGLDLVIDFASHKSSLISAEYCLSKNIPLIIGSTGQSEEENKRIDEISKHINIIKKANFSDGIEILKIFVKSVLRMNPEKFEIVEKHHKKKKDKPSGTAIELKNFIAQDFDGPIEINSIREGEEMGEHSIIAYVEDEKLMAKHNIYSREVFVKGIVQEVRKILS